VFNQLKHLIYYNVYFSEICNYVCIHNTDFIVGEMKQEETKSFVYEFTCGYKIVVKK